MVWWAVRDAPDDPATRLASAPQQRISNFPGSHGEPSISPDGRQLAYVDFESGRQLWTLGVPASEPRQRTFFDQPVSRPKWSPRGDAILLTRWEVGGASLWLLDWSSGEEQLIRLVSNARNGAWSGDGERIVFERGDELWLAAGNGRDQRRLQGVVSRDLIFGDRQPALSPTGDWVVFYEHDRGPMGDLWKLATAGGVPQRLTTDEAIAGGPSFTAEGRHVIFWSRRRGAADLWSVSIDGGEPLALTSGPGADRDLSLSADGSVGVFSHRRQSFVLVVSEPDSGREREIHERSVEIVDPQFDPEGRRIVFFGFDELGDVHVQAIDGDGSGLERITTGRGTETIHPSWSRSGRSIYAYRARPTPAYLEIDVETGQSQTLVPDWVFGEEHAAAVDSTGRYILYSRLDRGRPASTMVRDLESDRDVVLPVVLRAATWSPDDRRIAGVLWPDRRIVVCSREGADCSEIAQGNWPSWSADGERLYFLRRSDRSAYRELWVHRENGSAPEFVYELGPLHPIGPFYDVSEDGRVVWVRYEESKSELWMMGAPAI